MEFDDDYLLSDTEELQTDPEVDRLDPFVDQAKKALWNFFATEREEVFYERQLEVIFERQFFHWITAKALRVLVAEGKITSHLMPLGNFGDIRFYREKSYRYWRRKASEIISLVREFSRPEFTRAIGNQAEVLFDAAFASFDFVPKQRKVRSWKDKTWTETGHDLDRIYYRDGIAYGAEIKNTLPYIDRPEMETKIRMCQNFGARPLFIVRSAPKSYIEQVRKQGGFTLVFGYQLYPFGFDQFAKNVRTRLRLPVDCPNRIADGTIQRFLRWHVSQPQP